MSFANNQGLGTLWRYPRFPLVRASLRYRAYGSAPRSSNVLREEPGHIRNTLNRSYLRLSDSTAGNHLRLLMRCGRCSSFFPEGPDATSESRGNVSPDIVS